jgi:hypothetical protein
MLTVGLTELQAAHRPAVSAIIADSSENFLMYRNDLTALERAAHTLLMADVLPCAEPCCKNAALNLNESIPAID